MNDAPPTAIKDLAQWPRWVCWKTVERDGKTTKIPVTPSGRPASSTDPDTWSSHVDCVKAVKAGRFDGIGYVFAEDDEYFGVDLDHCVKDGIVHPDAMRIVQRMASYTEFSPSGDGLHVIGRGAVNGKRNRTKKTPWGHDFEVYDRARFFTVTGRQLFGSPAIIEARQEELDAICAEMFPAPSKNGNGHALLKSAAPVALDDVALEEKIRRSGQSAKYDRLMAGDLSGYDDNHSGADQALCNILAWWLGGDAIRMDSWFRRSGLMRDKWDEKRGDSTYGANTIAEGIASCTNGFYNPGYRERDAISLHKREEEFDDAIVELAVMCALPDDDEFVGPWRTGDGTAYRYYLPTRQGKVLDLDPLRSFTTAPKMNVEIASQLKTVPAIKAADMPKFISLLGRACDLRREMTLDDRIHALMVSYVQEAPERPSIMDNDQQGRVATFRWLDKHEDPLNDARSATQVSRHAPIIIDPNTGLRFVRQAWFHAYVKYHLGGTSIDRLGGRVVRLGWMQRGARGVIKATPADGGKEMFDHFYVIPVEWEEGHA